MKKTSLSKYTFLGLTILLFISCKTNKHVSYYQNIDQLSKVETSLTYESQFQPDDLLMIVVSAADSEAAAPFNLESTVMPSIAGQASQGQRQQQLYLVDSRGIVHFPVLGEIKLSGMTKVEATNLLTTKLKTYIKDVIVNIRIMNYKITVQGEVAKPGSYTMSSERITLPEALSLAGDLTIYGKRDNIILVRETNGKKSYNRVDITKADFINSPFYYLSQNDLIYVEPNKAKANSSTFNQNTSVWISIASLVSSAVLSILLINKN